MATSSIAAFAIAESIFRSIRIVRDDCVVLIPVCESTISINCLQTKFYSVVLTLLDSSVQSKLLACVMSFCVVLLPL